MSHHSHPTQADSPAPPRPASLESSASSSQSSLRFSHWFSRAMPCAWQRRAAGAVLLVGVAALVGLSGCDDGGTGGTEDTAADAMFDGGDTTLPSDTADDTATDTNTPSDTAEGDTEGDTTGDTPDTAPSDADDAVDIDDTCDPACGDNQMCADPAADTCACVEGFDDCDGDASNGCEADLRDTAPETCGSCDDGQYCDLFGVAQVCNWESAGCDPATCAQRHYDLDGDGAAATPTNGCETGFERFGTGATMLTGVGSDGLSQLVWDDTAQMLFGLEVGATVKVHAITIDAMGIPSVADTVDTSLAGSGATALGADAGFVAVTRTIGVNFYEWDGSELSDVHELNATDTLSVTNVGPVLADTRAEFVASTASGLTWYGVFDDAASAPDSNDCDASIGASVVVCEIATSTLNTNVTHMDYGSIGGTDHLVTVGDQSIEFTLVSDPAFDLTPTIGDDVSASSASAELLSGNTVAYVEGTEIIALDYMLDGNMVPEAKSEAHRVTLQDPAHDLVELDADRVAVATDGGVELVLLADTPGTAMLEGITVGATALARDDTRMFVATGDSLSVFELLLGPLE